jgi:hypothetical protein
MIANPTSDTVCVMQLIQIGEVKQKTVLELVQEMAARQLTEIEQLKIAAQNRSRSRHSGQVRVRCSSAKRLS